MNELTMISLGMLKDVSNYHNITFRINIKNTYISIELIKNIEPGSQKKKRYKFTNNELHKLTVTKIMEMITDINHFNF